MRYSPTESYIVSWKNEHLCVNLKLDSCFFGLDGQGLKSTGKDTAQCPQL